MISLKSSLKCFLFFILFLSFSQSAISKIVESIVAIVNDDIISLTDIEKYKEKLKNGTMVDDLLLNQKNVSLILKDRKQLLDLLISEKIIDSEVKRQGLEVTIERVEKEIRSIAEKNRVTLEQLKAALKSEGVRFSDYQDFTKTRIERHELIARSITSKIKISDEEISNYYVNTSGKKNTQIYEYTVAHILFRIDKRGEDAAFNRAKSVYLKHKDGSSPFETLASQYSEDPSFTDGGILGTFKGGELVGAIDDAIKKLEPGEVSKLVKTNSGYHIVKLVSKKLIPDPSLEREKNRIRNILFQQAFKKQFKFWLDQKRQEAFIRINAA